MRAHNDHNIHSSFTDFAWDRELGWIALTVETTRHPHTGFARRVVCARGMCVNGTHCHATCEVQKGDVHQELEVAKSNAIEAVRQAIRDCTCPKCKKVSDLLDVEGVEFFVPTDAAQTDGLAAASPAPA